MFRNGPGRPCWLITILPGRCLCETENCSAKLMNRFHSPKNGLGKTFSRKQKYYDPARNNRKSYLPSLGVVFFRISFKDGQLVKPHPVRDRPAHTRITVKWGTQRAERASAPFLKEPLTRSKC
jgi:hypothetical protein